MTDLAAALAPILERVRTDVTAVKTAKGAVYRSRDAVTAERIARHLNGGPARGVYCIKPGESTTRIAVLDLDSHKGEASWDEMAATAERVMDSLALNGLKPHAWRSSGGKGVHIFLLWDDAQDAYSVRTLLAGILGAMGYKNGTAGIKRGEIEIFPKQDAVPANGFGNQFFLPLAGESVPLEPLLGLEPLPRDAAARYVWESSAPVPLQERPVHLTRATPARAGQGSPDLERLRMALSWVKPDPETGDYSYDDWLSKAGMGLHYETDGSAEGLSLWQEWSARGATYPGDEVLEYKWSTFAGNKARMTTGGTIFALAKAAGWVEDVSGDFEIVAEGPDAGSAAQEGVEAPAAPVITDDKNHLGIAHRMIAERFTFDNVTGLKRFGGDWYAYAGTHYRMRDDEAIENALRCYLTSAKRQSVKVKKKKDKATGEVSIDKSVTVLPFNPTASEISAIFRATRTAAATPADLSPPCWLDEIEGVDGAGGDYIALDDGLLHLPSRRLEPHTARFFNLNALPFAWASGGEGGAAECPQWRGFLESVWPGDTESQECLQEIFGYLLTTDTAQQKMFLLQGEPRTGKGTIGRVLQALVGDANTVSTSFSQLAGPFGLEPLLGKTVALLPESRNSGARHVNIQDAVERLLSLSGEDKVGVDRKHKGAWHGHLKVRFLMMANNVPALGDGSGAFASRFICLKTGVSFLGREDEGLTARLLTELPGILRWSLDGHDRLKARRRFVQPVSGRAVMEELADANNHVRVFVRECCEVAEWSKDTEENFTTLKEDLYSAYRGWCITNGRDRPDSMVHFSRSLFACSKSITSGRMKPPKREYTYIGLRLKKSVGDML